uniref:Uncharacterized protein n=1 Tax=Kalanchoe fedtschenkoi TaxID=63787 RepID=A0A7N0TGU1_KALFE
MSYWWWLLEGTPFLLQDPCGDWLLRKFFLSRFNTHGLVWRGLDLVIALRHDYHSLTLQAQVQVSRFIQSKNAVLTIGALNHIDSAALCCAAISWNEEFSPLPKPLILVNIGGPTRSF